MRFYLKTFAFLWMCCVLSVFAQAQFFDSLQLQVGTAGTFASHDYQPLWLVANRFGTVTDQKSDLSTHVRFTNLYSFGKSTDSAKPFYLHVGLNLYNNDHFKQFFLEEGFVKAGYKHWQIRAGRFEEITGDLDRELSSGSLGVSGNALPIPKLGFAVTEYTDVPLTKGWLQFKGQISHGWFGNNRYMKDAFYHEKTAYLRFGKKKLKLYGGVQHFAEWGGRRETFQLEKSWKGFLDVLLVRAADDGSVGTSVNGILPNRPGDQRGLVELGFTWENEVLQLHGYNQTPFETGRDVDFRNVDRLIGLSFSNKSSRSFLKKILFEILSTKDMLSFVEIADRQSFYNNGFYKTGWEYEGRIVGTPLFINRLRASKYFTDVLPYEWNAPDNSILGNNNILNNRITGAHLGAFYSLTSLVRAKTILTYTKNYGTHSPGRFSPHKDQLYTLQQFSYAGSNGLLLVLGLGFDNGDLSRNVGVSLGVEKSFHRNK